MHLSVLQIASPVPGRTASVRKGSQPPMRCRDITKALAAVAESEGRSALDRAMARHLAWAVANSEGPPKGNVANKAQKPRKRAKKAAAEPDQAPPPPSSTPLPLSSSPPVAPHERKVWRVHPKVLSCYVRRWLCRLHASSLSLLRLSTQM